MPGKAKESPLTRVHSLRFMDTIKKGLYKAGPMITGTQGWREVSIEFEMPEGCRAAVVRLRRLPSTRFDSKIRGTSVAG